MRRRYLTATLESPTELGHLFASSAREAVLRAILLDPTRPYYQRQLEQATGLPIRAVQRELERLTAARLLYRHQEGNRVYYRVDRDYVFFPELRSMILKTAEESDLLRAQLATDPAVRAAFLAPEERAALAVLRDGQRLHTPAPEGMSLRGMGSTEFVAALSRGDAEIEGYLRGGIDLLGRRDDLLWRHIEAAGYSVAKGAGVP